MDRAIEYKQQGVGPDRILLMVSTSESHQRINSGLSIDEYWQMAEQKVKEAKEVGLKVNGTVSTIWGCPVEGPTDTKKAIEFTQRWLDIGADDVEHADHDGSASPIRLIPIFQICWRPYLTQKNTLRIFILHVDGDLQMYWPRCKQG